MLIYVFLTKSSNDIIFQEVTFLVGKQHHKRLVNITNGFLMVYSMMFCGWLVGWFVSL